MYIQVNNDGYITDCIDYSYANYIEVDFELPLPDHFIAGCYKYLGNNQYEHDEIKHAEVIVEIGGE